MSRIAWSRGYQEYIRGLEEIRAETWESYVDAWQDILARHLEAVMLPPGMKIVRENGSYAIALVTQEARDGFIRECELALLGRSGA